VVTDRRLLANDQVSAWIATHSARTDRLYAFVASADLYLLSDRLTGYPYLWLANIQHIPGAQQRLVGYLSGAGAPWLVVLYQDPSQVDPSGALARVLAGRFHSAARVAGYDILERNTPPPG